MAGYEKGDHLYAVFSPGYTHHGLYVGGGYVIDRTRKGVKKSTLYEFSEGHDIHIEEHVWRPFDRDQACERAYSELGNEDYNVLWNNCEHFVNWCISGFSVSIQVLAPLGVVAPQAFAMVLANYVGTKVLPTSALRFLSENKITQNDVTQTLSENPKINTVSILGTMVGTAATVQALESIVFVPACIFGAPLVIGSLATGIGVTYGLNKLYKKIFD